MEETGEHHITPVTWDGISNDILFISCVPYMICALPLQGPLPKTHNLSPISSKISDKIKLRSILQNTLLIILIDNKELSDNETLWNHY